MERLAYPEYIDSGFEWLGEVPSHWEVLRIKDLSTKVGSGVTPKGGANIYQSSGIPFLRSQNIQFHGLQLDNIAYIPEEIHDEMRNSKVYPNDVLLNITGASIGRCFYADESLGEANVNQHVCIIRPSEKAYTCYLHFVLCSKVGQSQIDIEQSGSGREGLNFEVLKCFRIPTPSLPEQEQIASFLDHKTSQIDQLIEKKKALIEKLNEQRVAIITHAVTKGLDQTVPMKDSGVEWLGEVPEHWSNRRLKFLAAEPLKYGANEAAELDDRDLPRYVRITDVKEDGSLHDDTFRSIPEDIAEPYLLEEGDILLARSGATVGKSFQYSSNWGVAAYAGYLIRFRIDQEIIDPSYAYYFFRTKLYWAYIYSTLIQSTIQNFSAEKYASIILPLPPTRVEQQKIAKFIKIEKDKIDGMEEKTEEAIGKLEEYRTALITAAVTGKIDVRHFKVPREI